MKRNRFTDDQIIGILKEDEAGTLPKIGRFQSFNPARRTIACFEAMLWLRRGFGFACEWTINDRNDLLAHLFVLRKVNKA